MHIGKWLGLRRKLRAVKIAGIWIGIVIGYQLYFRWIFSEKGKLKNAKVMLK